jgi:transposase
MPEHSPPLVSEAVAPPPATIVGVDISKETFDTVRLPGGEHRSWKNDSAGRAAFLEWLRKDGTCLLIFESTGGYEKLLIYAAQDAGHEVVLANPLQVRNFAKGQGQFAKTDRIDALILALFGQKAPLRTLEKTPEKRRELEALVARRRQLVQMQTMELNRKQQDPRPKVAKSINLMLKLLAKEIEQVEDLIARLIASDDDWQARAALLETVPGIGPKSSTILVTEMPELGRLNRQQIAALGGVAPYPHDSGQFRGQRRIRGGRSAVRQTLYMAAKCAIRFNPVFQAYSQRLYKAGKRYKVVVIACIRKLLVIVNTMIRNNTPWKTSQA